MVNWHFILFLFIFLKKSLQEAHLRRSFFLMCCSRSKEAHFKTICGQEIAASTRLLDLYTISFSIAEQIYPKLQRNDTPSSLVFFFQLLSLCLTHTLFDLASISLPFPFPLHRLGCTVGTSQSFRHRSSSGHLALPLTVQT